MMLSSVLQFTWSLVSEQWIEADGMLMELLGAVDAFTSRVDTDLAHTADVSVSSMGLGVSCPFAMKCCTVVCKACCGSAVPGGCPVVQVAACCAIKHGPAYTGLLAVLIFVGFMLIAVAYVVVLVMTSAKVGASGVLAT